MSEITKAENQTLKTKDKLVWLFFAALIVFVYFFALGAIPLLGPDEPRYAQVAREMFERGDFLTPTLGGVDWFEKPALLYWLEIISYKIFGVSEFAARFGSATCGLATILSLWILGRKAVQSSNFKVQSQPSENSLTIDYSPFAIGNFANWLALVAASSIGILVFARGASFDIVLTFPITASLAGFFTFDRKGENSGKTFHFSLLAFYFFIGVALLAKGLIGIIFPFAIVAFYFLLRRKFPNKTFVASLIWGTILSLLVASVWYAPMCLKHGWKFVDEFFIQHQFARYTSNKFQHPQPFWFFLLVLPLMTLPWLPFFAASIWRAAKQLRITNYELRKKENQSKSSERESLENENSLIRSPQLAALRTFALAWLAVPLFFFSFSGSKLPGYILPALPAAIVLTAEAVWRFARKSERRTRALQIFALATFLCVVAALQFFVRDYARGDTVKNLIKTADARGFAGAKILNFNDTFHSAEFYGAGRLVRDADGKQKRFFSAAEVAQELKIENAPVALVLAPLQFAGQLNGGDLLDAEILTDNGEAAIVSVRRK